MRAVCTCNYQFTHVEEGRVYTKYMLTLAHVREYTFYVFRVWIRVPVPRVSVRQRRVSEAVRSDVAGVGMLTSPRSDFFAQSKLS